MEKYKIKITSVDYCVEEEDVCWQFDNDTELEEDSEEYYNAIDNEIKKIKESLPQVMELDIECEKEDLEDIICDTISQETGWLINSMTYKII